MEKFREIIEFFEQDGFTDVDLNDLKALVKKTYQSSDDLETAIRFIDSNLKVFDAIQRKDVEILFDPEPKVKRKRILRKAKDSKFVTKAGKSKKKANGLTKLHIRSKKNVKRSVKKAASGYKPGRFKSSPSPGVYGKLEKFGPGKIIYIRSK